MGRALHGICAAVTTLCWWSQLHQSHQRCLKSLIATWAALRPAAPITPPPARKQKRGMEVHLCHTPLPSLCRPPGGSWLPALLTRVGSTPTQVQARNWGSVARVGWCWPGEVQLVQRHPSMEDVLPTELCVSWLCLAQARVPTTLAPEGCSELTHTVPTPPGSPKILSRSGGVRMSLPMTDALNPGA